MIQIINNEIKQYQLPKVGTLKDGRTVSGYHLLDEETLKAEGWLPLEDNPPEYDVETQYLISDGYEILEDKVIKKYRIENIAEEVELSEIDILNKKVELLASENEAKDDLLQEIILAMYSQ